MQRTLPCHLDSRCNGISSGHSPPSLESRAWFPNRPFHLLSDLDALKCNEKGDSCLPLETAGCLDKRPLDFVGPFRKRLGHEGLSVETFPYDWRRSLFQSAWSLASWVETRRFERIDIVAVSTGGLIATQYARLGFADRIRKFISIGTPFLGMPRALANLHTGAVLNRVADVFFAKRVRTLIHNFPSTYELLPCSDWFDVADQACVEVNGQQIHSHREMMSWLNSVPEISTGLLQSGTEFLEQLRPSETLRYVDSYYIVNSGQPTPARISYNENGNIRVLRETNGDGSVPLCSQTIGGRNEDVHPGHTFKFQGRHRTMHLNPPVMDQIARILLTEMTHPLEEQSVAPRIGEL